MKAAGLKPGQKVLTNAFTFTAVPSSIVHAGGVPIYLECDERLIVDLDDLRRKVEAHPDARFFLLSHMRGHIANMVQVFGRMDNSRYFRNWRYSYEELPELKQTEEILAVACDLRISLTFTPEDVRTLALIILEALGTL